MEVPEDHTTCFADCHGKDYIKCDIDRIKGGVCKLSGIGYNFGILSRDGCENSTSVVFNITSPGNQTIKEFRSGKWIEFGNNNYLKLFPVSCIESSKYFEMVMEGPCIDKICKISIELIPSSREIFQLKNNSIKIFPNISGNLLRPFCEFYIKRNTSRIYQPHVSDTCENKTIDSNSLEIGKWQYKVRVYDQKFRNFLAEDQIKFIVSECEFATDCEDGDHCSLDYCVDMPQVCIHERINGCSFENNCIPNGKVVGNFYCAENNEIQQRKGKNAECFYNYECQNDRCVGGRCSFTFWETLKEFFGKFFRKN
jgi:hypothetical protein